MQVKLLSMVIASVLLLTACGDSNNSNQSTEPQPPAATVDNIAAKYQGHWQAPGYGLSLAITSDNVDVYRHTSDYCMHISEEQDVNTTGLERFLRMTEQTQLEWFSGLSAPSQSVPGIRFNHTNALPLSCQNEVISMLDGSDPELTITQLWQLYSQIFAEYYVDFDAKGVDWLAVSQQAAANLNDGSTLFNLFQAMEQTLIPLADGHNFVQHQQGWSAKTLTKPTLLTRLIEEFALANELPYPIPDNILTQELVNQANAFIISHISNQWQLVSDYASQESDIHTAANGQIRWFENQGLGYLYIGSMHGYADVSTLDELAYVNATLNTVNNALDQALTELAEVNGLIIDVRNNDGGHDFVSLAIASRFTDSATHVYSKQARDGNSRTPLIDVTLEPNSKQSFIGPTVVLTSTSTASAAEVFALSMSQLPQVTLVGEASHGVFSNVMEWHLPGGFHIGLSNEYYLSPEGEWFEGKGVPVDVVAPFYTVEQRQQETDLGIEAAIAVLTQQ